MVSSEVKTGCIPLRDPLWTMVSLVLFFRPFHVTMGLSFEFSHAKRSFSRCARNRTHNSPVQAVARKQVFLVLCTQSHAKRSYSPCARSRTQNGLSRPVHAIARKQVFLVLCTQSHAKRSFSPCARSRTQKGPSRCVHAITRTTVFTHRVHAVRLFRAVHPVAGFDSPAFCFACCSLLFLGGGRVRVVSACLEYTLPSLVPFFFNTAPKADQREATTGKLMASC